MKKLLIALLLLTSCKTNKLATSDPCPNGTSNYPKQLDAIVQKTCFTQSPKSIGASAWSKNKNKWPYTSLVLYFYPEKSLFGGNSPNTSSFVHDVLKYCKVYEDYSNIRFYTTNDINKADIKVSNKCNGYWSVVGKSAANLNQVTLNLDWEYNAPEIEKRRSGLHEISHAIGMEHEHLNPSINIVWDEPAVYAFYESTQGWTREQTRRNVLERYKGTDTLNSGYDYKSIMHYPIASELTKNNVEVGWNTVLTERDVQLVNQMYPVFIGKNGLTKKTLTSYNSRLID